jgi:hypothetical protein
MRKMRSRNFLLTHLLPIRVLCRESHVQYSLNPARCQRTTVQVVRGSMLASIPARAVATSSRTIDPQPQSESAGVCVSKPRVVAGELDFPAIDRGVSGQIERAGRSGA